MKLKTLLAIIVSAACVSQLSMAGNSARTWGFGLRQHAEQPDFPDISFGDELSYGLSLSAIDAGGYWQGALLYTPEIEGADYAITPEINLVLTENAWRMGVGGAKTYISTDTDSGWRDFFWQLLVGVGLPGIGAGKLELRAIYMFDEWDNVDNFDVDNLEYAIWMGIPF
jgi:hypothetical protein